MMAMNPAKMDKDKWIKIFIETKEISAARNKRFIRIFGEWSLVRTDQKELFEYIIDGNKLMETKVDSLFQQPTLSMVLVGSKKPSREGKDNANKLLKHALNLKSRTPAFEVRRRGIRGQPRVASQFRDYDEKTKLKVKVVTRSLSNWKHG
jgi:hypothetical protein